MRLSLATLLLTALTTHAKPLLPHAVRSLSTRTASLPKPFYLVTTTSPHQNANSSQLSKVLSLDLIEPRGYTSYFLFDIGPGEASYPQFTLVDGTLRTEIPDLTSGNGTADTLWNSTTVVAGGELAFSPGGKGYGDLSLVGGFLLAVNGSATGWVLCTELEQYGASYIVAGALNETCTPTYIQAVAQPPFPYLASSPSTPLKDRGQAVSVTSTAVPTPTIPPSTNACSYQLPS